MILTDRPQPGAPPSAPFSPLPGSRRWWVLASLATGSFMSGLDSSIVNTVLPTITRSFGSDIATSEWVITAYLLVLSALMLTFGRLGDLHGHRRIYLWGFGLFTVSSALCGVAPRPEVLVGARVTQAAGAAILSANSAAILTSAFPASERGRALGLQVTIIYIGLALGPALGGWLADHATWRAVFYINVPVGIAALLMSIRFVPHDTPTGEREKFDLAGAVLFSVGLLALLLGLNQGHVWGWFSPTISALFLSAIALLALFIRRQRTVVSPMLDTRIFRSRLFTASILSTIANYFGEFTVLFVLPYTLIQARALSPSQAGVVLAAQPVVMTLVAPISGVLSDRIGGRLPSTVGMILQAVSVFLLSRTTLETSLPTIGAILALGGLGLGLFSSPNTSTALGSVPPHRRGVASAVLGTGRNLGMVLGIGVAGAIFTTLLATSGINPSPPDLVRAANGAMLIAVVAVALGACASAAGEASRRAENG